ncbi:alpha/beta fold hydrolase [Antrihabitans cavernicola]|uniref:alpha/beta fold hydrolase n=1 Tax=Antrihabitans cavernicola TaxID=2495913 RepID=UPI001F44AE14|nr:alpha/beta hydrolase [Spelaeibacter cavernicola]
MWLPSYQYDEYDVHDSTPQSWKYRIIFEPDGLGRTRATLAGVATDKPSLVLLHGVTMSAHVWDDVVPLLSGRFDVIAPTATGHRGGPPPDRPTTVSRLVDDADRVLDDAGLDRPHLAGNSLGGWMAIELARRGRAASVCALSPAGLWTAGEKSQSNGVAKIRRSLAITRLSRPPLPVLLRSGTRSSRRSIRCPARSRWRGRARTGSCRRMSTARSRASVCQVPNSRCCRGSVMFR